MESQPQNPEFRYNPENFDPCRDLTFGLGLPLLPYFASARNEGSEEAPERSLLADMSTKLLCAGPYDPAHGKTVVNAYV